jgi:hypothetical protein
MQTQKEILKSFLSFFMEVKKACVTPKPETFENRLTNSKK